MNALAREFVASFEGCYGYPPEDNEIIISDVEEAGSRSVLFDVDLPQEIIDFYAVVEEVSFSDVGNGYFVHQLEQVISGIHGQQPTRVIGAVEDNVVVFGSSGGGELFALSSSGRGIYGLGGGAFLENYYDADSAGLSMVANDFLGFLEFLRHELWAAMGR